MIFESITALDLSILDFIHNTLSNPVMDVIMKILTYSIEYGETALAVFIVMMCIKKMRKTGFAVLGATLAVLLFGELILKHLIRRPRPFVINGAIELIIKAPSGFSFPSCHTAICVAMATAIFLFHKRLGIIAYIYAALVAFSRMYLYVHYPSDIIGGIALGIGCGIGAVALVKLICKKIDKHKELKAEQSEQKEQET
ncbi:MAG: phosphatase PAP2 family protein [Ruminiclostridium sp.]